MKLVQASDFTADTAWAAMELARIWELPGPRLPTSHQYDRVHGWSQSVCTSPKGHSFRADSTRGWEFRHHPAKGS